MIFIFSLVIAALLCIASFICYKVSGKMLDEKMRKIRKGSRTRRKTDKPHDADQKQAAVGR